MTDLENIKENIEEGHYNDLEDIFADFEYEVTKYAKSDLNMGEEDDFVLSDDEIIEQAQTLIQCPYINLQNEFDVDILKEVNRLKLKFGNSYKVIDILEKY